MSVPLLVSRGTEPGNVRDDARRGIPCGARASACEVSGAYLPYRMFPAVPYSTPGSPVPVLSLFSLYGKEEEREVQSDSSLKNKAKTRTPTAGTGGGTEEERVLRSARAYPAFRPRCPITPTRVRGTDKSRRAAVTRCPIRSFRASPRLLASPRAFLSDSGPLASRVASSPPPAPLFGAHNRASFGCDNPAACESGPSVRPGWVVGDGGGGGKKRGVPAPGRVYVRGGPEIRTTRTVRVLYGASAMPDMTPAAIARRRERAARELAARERRTTPEERQAENLRKNLRKFGISPEEYEARLVLQDGRCATCRRAPSKTTNGKRALAVDHCHRTGATRGLLCHRCNTALGQLCDDVHTLRNLIRYLEIHGA